LHIGSTLLLFGVLLRMTAKPGRSLFAVALFAVHPLHVESVAWVAERKDVLSTLFFMLTLWSYAAYVRRPSRARYLAVMAFLAIGLLAKPMLVTMPFLLLVLDVWPLARVRWSSTWEEWRPLVFEKLPMLALTAAASVTTFLMMRSVGAVMTLENFPVAQRVGHALVSYVIYLRQTLWPAGLVAFYPYPLAGDPVWLTVLSALLLAVATVLAVRFGRHRPYLLAGWLWFLGALVPVIGFVTIGIQSTADRFMYVPMLGLIFIVAWGIADLVERRWPVHALLPAMAAAAVFACAVTARAQVATWANSESVWRHALEVSSDNYYAHGALGPILARQNRLDEALAHMTAALSYRPDLAEVQNDLGEVFARQGRLADATHRFAEAVRLMPAFAEAHHNLGVALASQDRPQEATAQFVEALRLNPDLAETHNALGKMLLGQNQLTDAATHFAAAVRLMPGLAEAHVNHGIALAGQGRTDDAIRELQEGLRLASASPDVHCDLAVLLVQRGRTAEAVTHLHAALAIAPGHARARRMLDDLTKNGGR
jgi:Flp pilus assembly protein TadD